MKNIPMGIGMMQEWSVSKRISVIVDVEKVIGTNLFL